jgi:hypothetical protein
MLSIINYGIGAVTPGDNDYLIRQVQAAEATEMETLVAAMNAAVVATNTGLSSPNQFTPADANLAGAGDGHTFIFTATFIRRSLNFVLPNLLGFAANLLPQSPPGSLGYPLPVPPAFVPGPEAFSTKFCLASEQDAVSVAFNDMVSRALTAAGVPADFAALPAIWQQIVGSAKGTRFMGGVSVLSTPQQGP